MTTRQKYNSLVRDVEAILWIMGANGLAAYCNITPSAVRNWQHNGYRGSRGTTLKIIEAYELWCESL